MIFEIKSTKHKDLEAIMVLLSPYLLNLYENAKLLLAELSDLQKWGTNRLLYSSWVTLLVYLISCNLTNFYTRKIKNPGQGREGIPLVVLYARQIE